MAGIRGCVGAHLLGKIGFRELGKDGEHDDRNCNNETKESEVKSAIAMWATGNDRDLLKQYL